MTDSQSLLRNSLRANGAFSALSGLTFSFGADSVAGAMGLADARIVLAVGLGLLGFAALLAFVSSRETLPLRGAMHIVWADLAWVIGTVPVLLLGVLNRTGAITALAIAAVVLLFAALQYQGVRRISGLAAPGAPS